MTRATIDGFSLATCFYESHFRLDPISREIWTGRSQAVSLPKEFRFETDTVLVRREGQAVILEPAFEWPERWVESFAGAPDDFVRPAHGQG